MEITESQSEEVTLRLRPEGGRRHQREKSKARRETQGYEAGGEPTWQERMLEKQGELRSWKILQD